MKNSEVRIQKSESSGWGFKLHPIVDNARTLGRENATCGTAGEPVQRSSSPPAVLAPM
jgi:hypothetical protein